ncbi:hypothetical protein TWF694_002554 [Orbilia ellipsospora]|uniref:SprT-like domain-containing protein n=1 Tax=Orbilia ellipsospora TaxID=2528407 RepID=A0AAV9X2B1_9PEZI
MVRLSTKQTTHDEWVEENGNAWSSEEEESLEQIQQVQDESHYFSCDGETSIVDDAAGESLNTILSDDQDTLPAEATNDVGGIEEMVASLSLSAVKDEDEDEDEEDEDDVIIGCRGRKMVLGTQQPSSKTKPRFSIAISDKSDIEETEEHKEDDETIQFEESEVLDEPAEQLKKENTHKPLRLSSATWLNQRTERKQELIFNDIDLTQIAETPKRSPQKRPSILSIKATKSNSTLNEQFLDDIDALSRGMGDLAVDDDHLISFTPHKFKRPPKIFKRTASSSIFDFSDSEAENSDSQNTLNIPKTPATMPRAKPKTKSLAPKTVEKLKRKSFEDSKDQFAKDYLKELDETVNNGEIGKLTAQTGGIQLVWTNAKQTTAGTCQVRRYSTGEDNLSAYFACTITLEVKVCDDFDRVRDTLAHEYSHACVDILELDRRQLKNEGPHGKSFKTWAKKVGKAMGIPVPTTCHDMVINYKFEYQCPSCGHIYKAHSRKKEWTTTKGCEGCKVPLVQIKPVPRTVKKDTVNGLTEYQKFQKETFARLKREQPPGTPFNLVATNKQVNQLWKEKKAKDEAFGKPSLREKLEAARESTSKGVLLVESESSQASSDDLQEFGKLVITID